MFEDLDDQALVAGIEVESRAESAAAARRLAFIAELASRRAAPSEDAVVSWACDDWDATAAEVGAAMNIGHRAASKEMRIAEALRERLPRVAALFARGAVSTRVVETLTWRTQLVTDARVWAVVDAELASRVHEFGPMSVVALERSVDSLLEKYDPAAVRRTRQAARDRDVRFGKPDDETGTASIYGRVLVTDREAYLKRIAQLVAGVCVDDPRTAGQRRSDAMGVIAVGGDRLACLCASPDCPAAGTDPRAANTMVYVFAERPVLDAKPDPYVNGDDAGNPIPIIDAESEAASTSEPEPEPGGGPARAPAFSPQRATAVIVGGGIVPAPWVAQLIASGAKVKELREPSVAAEMGYRPSAGLAAFVRMRDLTCRFPGCDRPAEFCDIDHTEPFPGGATHASNTKCLCRIHHLVKTFWAGFVDRQLPDGRVVWTMPSGRTHITVPGSRWVFPQWDTTTSALPPPPPRSDSGQRGVMMPRRRLTRAAQRARQINNERARNQAYLSERNKPPPS
ncbi:HNH endonuclease [Mycolicibacterium goodii]|nr:HNH endonuclease [Mycolicibacterium goodii]MBU8815048.1 HNH endonuclease [Mycolicibacterium goodii]MBU8830051.1 HNH endonuclease [Mycolicibacterium goodii]